MQREVSYVKVVRTFLRVASSRCHPTTIKFSGQASAQDCRKYRVFLRFRIDVQPRRAAKSFRHHRTFLRILFGVNLLGILIAERQPHPLQKIHHENATQKFAHRALVSFAGTRMSSADRAFPLAIKSRLPRRCSTPLRNSATPHRRIPKGYFQSA